MIWMQFLSFGALYSQWNLNEPGIRMIHGYVSLPHPRKGLCCYIDHFGKGIAFLANFFFLICGFISRKSLLLVNYGTWERINLHETGVFLVSLEDMEKIRTAFPNFVNDTPHFYSCVNEKTQSHLWYPPIVKLSSRPVYVPPKVSGNNVLLCLYSYHPCPS